MNFCETKLKGAYVIDLNPLIDDRGVFTRTFCKTDFREIGHKKEFVQFNHSVTHTKGTIRGMHYQSPPESEVKLIMCMKGKVHDVLIDLRQNSPTFLNWIGIDLSVGRSNMIYVPEGIAHGFQTLEDNCELLYYHTSAYSPKTEGGVRYDDDRVNIKWPIEVTNISEKDKTYPMLNAEFRGL